MYSFLNEIFTIVRDVNFFITEFLAVAAPRILFRVILKKHKQEKIIKNKK